MRPVLPPLRRNKIGIANLGTVILLVTLGVVSCWETVGQTTEYLVSELSGSCL
jgi:hypothetical protein